MMIHYLGYPQQVFNVDADFMMDIRKLLTMQLGSFNLTYPMVPQPQD